MSIQIFGTKKCNGTKKAIRFFKERNIAVQFIDLNIKGMSKGELRSVSSKIPLEDLINKESKEYKNKNLNFIQHDIEEVLLEHPLLLKTPVVRNKNRAVLGADKKLLEGILDEK